MSASVHDLPDAYGSSAGSVVRLAILGDVHLGEPPFFELDHTLVRVLHEADLTVANQESPITDVADPIGGKCCIRTVSAGAERLRDWGIDAVTLANNHVFDHGRAGFESTCAALDSTGIRQFGAGTTLEAAYALCKLEARGLRIGLLGFASRRIQTTCATESSFGCAPLDETLMVERVALAASEVDLLVVLPHWGFCEYTVPRPEDLELGRRLLEAGADAVVGHHPHVVQGAVSLPQGVLAPSLGNFAFQPFFDRGTWVLPNRENARGLILLLHADSTGVRSFEPIFTRQCNNRIEQDDDPDRYREWTQRCTPLSAPAYHRYWRRYVRKRALLRILHYCNVRNWSRIRKETLIGAWLLLRNSVLGNRSARRR